MVPRKEETMNNTYSIVRLGFAISLLGLLQACATSQGKPDMDGSQQASVLTLNKPADIKHTVGAQERLIDISLKYTGSKAHWQAIADHNGITDPRLLRIGSTLTIPASLLQHNTSALKPSTAQQSTFQLPTSADTSIAPTSSPLAIKRALSRPASKRPPERQAEDAVFIQKVSTNRSFDLNPIDETTVASRTHSALPDAKVKVVGTYYPKGIYRQPANYSDLILRALPGTLFQLEDLTNGWYKIVTSQGVGYLRKDDGAIIMNDVKQ